MSAYLVTTALKFADGRLEGQVLHLGNRESCEELASMIPAVAYSGPNRVIDSRLLIVPEEEMPGVAVGQSWEASAS